MLPFDLGGLSGLEWHRNGPNEPYRITRTPDRWHVLGTGNYAAVLYHDSDPELVVKMRLFEPQDEAVVRREFEEEKEVYRRIGEHHSFSSCLYASFPFLVLKRLHGVTLHRALTDGIRIPKRAIDDINEGLEYARNQGLHPHDVHIKNVMLYQGRGYIADISDFLKEDYCRLWDDSMIFFKYLYRPLIYPLGVPVPAHWMHRVKVWYRRWVPYGER